MCIHNTHKEQQEINKNEKAGNTVLIILTVALVSTCFLVLIDSLLK